VGNQLLVRKSAIVRLTRIASQTKPAAAKIVIGRVLQRMCMKYTITRNA
jgi:hypothetical protein